MEKETNVSVRSLRDGEDDHLKSVNVSQSLADIRSEAITDFRGHRSGVLGGSFATYPGQNSFYQYPGSYDVAGSHRLDQSQYQGGLSNLTPRSELTQAPGEAKEPLQIGSMHFNTMEEYVNPRKRRSCSSFLAHHNGFYGARGYGDPPSPHAAENYKAFVEHALALQKQGPPAKRGKKAEPASQETGKKEPKQSGGSSDKSRKDPGKKQTGRGSRR